MRPDTVCHCCGTKVENPIECGGFKYCRRCFDSNFEKCECCGEYYLRSEGAKLRLAWKESRYNTYPVCNKCRETLVRCEVCNRYEKKDHVGEIGGFDIVCHNCAEAEFRTCACCGEKYHTDKINLICYYTTPRQDMEYKSNAFDKSEYLCETCREEKLSYCSECGLFFETVNFDFVEIENDDGYSKKYCKPCYHKYGVVHEYSYKPEPIIHRKKDENRGILFGIENEIEFDIEYGDYDRRDYELKVRLSKENMDVNIPIRKKEYVANLIDEKYYDFIYQKNDGSLKYGLELVTHPASMNFLYDIKENMKNLFSMLKNNNCIAGTDAPTSGMHVHISKYMMDHMHKLIFSTFIYRHSGKIKILAGRNSPKYSKFISVPKSKLEEDLSRRFLKNNSYNDRYVAVNWRNSKTVELRIFQSTLDVDRFYANLEFCDALYKYSLGIQNVSELFKRTSWLLFCRFVEEMQYENLIEHLRSVELWRLK